MGHLRISAIIILILTSCTLRGQLGEINTESVNIGNTAGTAFWNIRQDPADNTKLEFFAGSTVWMEIAAGGPALVLATNIVPTAASTYVIGTVDDEWLDIFSEDFHAGKSTTTRVQGRMFFANTTDGTTGSFVGISKDASGTIEVSNLTISGNFYGRTLSGDADCTFGVDGVEDGWTGFQTTTKELQVCSGTATRAFPSVLSSDTPLTETCTGGNVLINAVIKNGIIIGGTCAAN